MRLLFIKSLLPLSLLAIASVTEKAISETVIPPLAVQAVVEVPTLEVLPASSFQIDFSALEQQSVLTLNILFPQATSLDEVVNLLKNNELKSDLSEFIARISTEELHDAENHYRLVTVGEYKKFGLSFRRTIGMLCSEKSNSLDDSWKQTCVSDNSFKNTADFFISAHETTECKFSQLRVKCVFRAIISPQAISIPILFERNEFQLALAGLNESLKFYSTVYLITQTKTTDLSRANLESMFEKSLFKKKFTTHIDGLWLSAKKGTFERKKLTLQAFDTTKEIEHEIE